MYPEIQSRLKALFEVLKDFARWVISYFLAWFVAHGFDFMISFFTAHHIVIGPIALMVLTTGFKYVDYYYHRYQKMLNPVPGEPQGIYKI